VPTSLFSVDLVSSCIMVPTSTVLAGCWCWVVAVQAVNQSIIEHESELSEMTHLSSELQQLAVDDNVTKLDSELQSITDRYEALHSTSEQRLAQMTELPALLERFYTGHRTVVSLVTQLESDLQQKDLQPGSDAELHLQVSLFFLLTVYSVLTRRICQPNDYALRAYEIPNTTLTLLDILPYCRRVKVMSGILCTHGEITLFNVVNLQIVNR